MITSTKYHLKIKMTGPLLGSQPGKDTPASDYIRDKVKEERPDLNIADEVGTIPEELSKGTTGFFRDANGKPMLYNYQIKGMIKEAADVLNGLAGLKAFKSKIDNLLFISPRQIPIEGKLADKPLERPLRAMTMQGPRTSLARSEMIEEGATLECDIEILTTPKGVEKGLITEEILRDLLTYGARKGLGQWRNSGLYGQFDWELTSI